MNETVGKSGLRTDRLAYLVEAMEGDIAKGKYYGGVFCIGRHGEIALHEAVGHAYRNQKYF